MIKGTRGDGMPRRALRESGGINKIRSRESSGIETRFLMLIHPLRKKVKEIYLFGSRCRDDWRPDSDYDILIVIDRKDKDIVGRLYDAVMDILFETGKLVSLKIFTTSEFNRLRSIPTPFMNSVMRRYETWTRRLRNLSKDMLSSAQELPSRNKLIIKDKKASKPAEPLFS